MKFDEVLRLGSWSNHGADLKLEIVRISFDLRFREFFFPLCRHSFRSKLIFV